jgi:hypothetical protein
MMMIKRVVRALGATLAVVAGLLLASGVSWAVPMVSYANASNVNGMLRLDVRASDFTDLYGFQLDLTFDPRLVQVFSITEGSFLASAGSTFFDAGTIDNVSGVVAFSFGTLIGPGAGVSGSGVLESVLFSVRAPGNAVFGFANGLAVDSSLNPSPSRAKGSRSPSPSPRPLH